MNTPSTTATHSATIPVHKPRRSARLLISILRTISRIPLRLLYGVSDLAALILYYGVRYRRKVVASNLKLAFPEMTDAERKRIEKRFYRHFPDIFIEALKLFSISDRETDRRINIENAELVDDALRRGHSVVLFLGHYGNWEWVTSICRKFTEPCITSQIYHPLSDKTFDEVMLELRTRYGGENIPMASAVRRLLEITRNGEKFVCGFIADQRPNGYEHKHWTDFLGIDTPYMTGGEAIGRKVGAEFLYVDVIPGRRGHYTLRFEKILPPEDDKGENPVTREYLRMLEATIRRAPEYWLWSHNRWAHKRNPETNQQEQN